MAAPENGIGSGSGTSKNRTPSGGVSAKARADTGSGKDKKYPLPAGRVCARPRTGRRTCGRRCLWDDDTVHYYEWTQHEMDGRCPKCLVPWPEHFMIRDALWQESGLDGVVCFRCIEKAIGRELTPDDFKPDVPINAEAQDPELRERIGLPVVQPDIDVPALT